MKIIISITLVWIFAGCMSEKQHPLAPKPLASRNTHDLNARLKELRGKTEAISIPKQRGEIDHEIGTILAEAVTYQKKLLSFAESHQLQKKKRTKKKILKRTAQKNKEQADEKNILRYY
jgi:hypothetical protein